MNNLLLLDLLFSYCSSLKFLPDISKWNINNIINFNFVFFHCSSLKSLPDISKWNIFNSKANKRFFNYFFGDTCEEIIDKNTFNLLSYFDVKYNQDTFLGDFSINFKEVEYSEEIKEFVKETTFKYNGLIASFAGCSSLEYIPDISKWNMKNAIIISKLFLGCTSLKSLPDISKWEINNILTINSLFKNCSSLEYMPDISKWDTSNVIVMNNLFYGCSKLKELPDISKWNTNNVKDMSDMFKNCNNLQNLPKFYKK